MVGELAVLALKDTFAIDKVDQGAFGGVAQRHHGFERSEGRVEDQVLVLDSLFNRKFFFFQ